jgi:hypothetical protein
MYNTTKQDLLFCVKLFVIHLTAKLLTLSALFRKIR